MKVTAKVHVIYTIEIDTDKNIRKDIMEELENYWDSLVGFGLEDEHYHDTEINIE